MKMNMTNILIGAVVALVLASLSMFVVDQRQTAIVFQLGEMISVKTEPGFVFQVAADAERALLRFAHPDAGYRRT